MQNQAPKKYIPPPGVYSMANKPKETRAARHERHERLRPYLSCAYHDWFTSSDESALDDDDEPTQMTAEGAHGGLRRSSKPRKTQDLAPVTPVPPSRPTPDVLKAFVKALRIPNPSAVRLDVDTCAVCRKLLNDSRSRRSCSNVDLAVVPRCGHIACRACLEQWTETHLTCPVCNIDLIPP